jgi:hypothetical protein
VTVLGLPAGALDGGPAVTLALYLLVASTLAGRHPAQIPVMVVVKRSGGRGSSSYEKGSGGNERKEGSFHGKWALERLEKEGKEERRV